MSIFDAIKTIFRKPQVASVTQNDPGPSIQDTVASASDVNSLATQALVAVLRSEGFDVQLTGSEIVLPSGISLVVKFIESAQINAEKIRTSSAVIAFHERYFPDGLTEFQHGGGDHFEQALAAGFRSWVQMDLVTLEDSIRDIPQYCSVMEMKSSVEDSSALSSQVIFGPTGHFVSDESQCVDSEHPFCPCCLFMNSIDAFRELLTSNQFSGIRLFASRNGDGTYSADCRVNGEDFPLGVEHLQNYAQSWPDCGFEYRKQYVVIRQVGALITNS